MQTCIAQYSAPHITKHTMNNFFLLIRAGFIYVLYFDFKNVGRVGGTERFNTSIETI